MKFLETRLVFCFNVNVEVLCVKKPISVMGDLRICDYDSVSSVRCDLH